MAMSQQSKRSDAIDFDTISWAKASLVGLGATLAGWLALLLGQRIIVAPSGWAKLCTWAGAALLVTAFAERLWAQSKASSERRGADRLFTALSALSLLSAAVYYATTDRGRELLHVKKPALAGPDKFGSIATVAWIALFLCSVLPQILGEISRWSMHRAEKAESRRVSAAVAAGLALACAALYGTLFTYAADKSDKYADFSYFRVSRPSESTKRMIDSLSEPLEVLVFLPPTTEVRPQVMKYLNDLRAGRQDKLSVSVHDFLGEPALAAQHNLHKDGALVLVRGKASQKLDVPVQEQNAQRILKKLDGEFQKVLIKAMRDKRTAYLTVGHGELNEDTDKRNAHTGEGVRQMLEFENYGVKNLGVSSGLGTEVPKDAAMVLVLGPQKRFLDGEVDTLRKYAEGGGRLFLALDPDNKPDLAPLAAIVGIDWKPELLVEEVPQVHLRGTAADKKILPGATFSSHAAVSTLSRNSGRAAVLFAGAARLERLKDADSALLIDFAVKSLPNVFIDEDGDLNFDPSKDKRGVFNLAAAVSRRMGDGKDAPELRAFVLGDADCLSDFWVGGWRANEVMFREAVRWLGGEESFSGEIQSEEDVPIAHTKADDQTYFYGTILGVPSLVLGLGFVATAKKKKKPRRARPSGEPPRDQNERPKKAEPAAESAAKEPAQAKSEPPREEPKAEPADERSDVGGAQ